MNTPITINFSTPEAVKPEKRHLSARSGMRTLWWAMRQGILAARESRNTLPWLAPEKARELFDRWLRGEYAQVQWAWNLMEKYDETLFAVKRARLSALQDMPWQVVIDADAVGEDSASQQLAEAQKQHLNTLLGNVENLRAALRHLGTADFRGYAALEICGSDERMRWETIEPWLLVRPNLAGPLMYNEKAEDTPARPELLDTERVLLREAEPIDLPAMFLLTAKHHSTKAWDAFLDTFGIPSIFLETPPNTTEEQALEYQQKVEDIVGEGRGTIPNGAKFHTVETGQKETKSFQDRADWCKDALLILATGGLLTVTAESGSGTLAGNAHADSFERLCTASAQDISEVVDFQFCRRKLKERFPGQPILAHFELAPEQPDDRAAQAQILATLAGAGFKPSAEVVSEMMGFEVTEAQPPQGSGMPMLNTAAPNIITNSAGVPPAKGPLNEAEMNALQSLASGKLSAEGLQGASNAMAGALQSAITNSESEACRAKDPEHCRTHGEQSEAEDAALARQEEREKLESMLEENRRLEELLRERESMESAGYAPWEVDMNTSSVKNLDMGAVLKARARMEARLAELEAEEGAVENSRSYKRDSNGRFASTGADLHKQKGARSTKGNPKAKTQQSNVPSQLPSHASDGKLERQLVKALDATDAHKGNQTVTRGSEKYNLTQARSDHRRKHQEQKVDNQLISKALTQGKFERSGSDGLTYRNNTKVIKGENMKGRQDITTAYHETEYRNPYQKRKPRT